MADSTDDEEYEYDEQASVSEDYPDDRIGARLEKPESNGCPLEIQPKRHGA